MVTRHILVRTFVRAVLVASLLMSSARFSAAQSLGTFRFQLQPFCNVVSMSIVQVGPVFGLDGFDDQCGVESRSSVVGTAFFNPDGSVGIGLTLISVPGGRPIHIGVALSTATLQGPWWDSAGNLGTFVFTPGSGAGGNPRPFVGGIGAAAIDPTQVQRRVTGACAPQSVLRAINEDGTVACEPGGGDITSVTAAAGLTGGASSGAAALAVNFAGPGIAATAARSDHTHEVPGFSNIAVGNNALSANSSGVLNTAVGNRALEKNTGASDNTAFGSLSLANATTGGANTGIGVGALQATSMGGSNTAVGEFAGDLNTTGHFNTLVGMRSDVGNSSLFNASAFGALARVDASNAIVLGSVAGVNNAASNVNVGIGTTAPAFPLQVVSADGAGRIQIGNTSEFWSASERRIVSFGDGTFVYVGEEDADDRLVLRAGQGGIRFKLNPNGGGVAPEHDDLIPLGLATNRWKAVYAALGTIQTSDARLKTNIAALDHGVAALLRIRPVSFAWKDDKAGRVNLGLLAQEVDQVIPEAVVHGATPDEPLGMNYSTLIPVLIKAIQEQQARIDAVAPPSAAAQLLGGQIPVLPAVDPVAFTLCTPEGPGSTQTCNALGFPASYKVPPGKRLIIEQVAGTCGGDADQDESTEAAIVAQTAGVIVGHPISGPLLPPGSTVRIPLTLTRIYADPQSVVTIGLSRVGGFSNRQCWLRFSGQLVKP